MAGQMHVLVVDSRSSLRKSLAALIAGRGWTVCEAAGASRALAEVAARRFDLVVAGSSIRGMETADFCRALRGLANGTGPVVVAMLASEGGAPALIEAGADDCLSQSLDPAGMDAAFDILAARAARQLRDARFRDFFENASDGMFTATLDARITAVNRATEGLTGFGRTELIGMDLADVIAPEQQGLGLEMVRRKVEGEASTTKYEVDIITKGGRRVPVEVVSQVVLEDGQPSALQTVARDITHRRRIEEDLRASEERFRSLVQNAFEVVTISDPDGTLRYVSPSVERLMGYAAEDWAGRSILSFIHPDDLSAATSGFTNAVKFPGVRNPLELRVRHRDGSWRVLETVAYNLLADPAVGGIVHNSRDVTERWRAQEALGESERHFQALAEVSPVGIFRAGPDGLCTYANKRWCQISGLTVEESLGRGWLRAVHLADAQAVAESWQASMRDMEHPFRLEFRLQRPDGTVAWAFVQSIAERAPDGSVSGFVGAVTDMTARKLDDERLRKASEFTTSVMNTVTSAIASLDLEGTITLVNDRLVEISGYSREELIGRGVETLVPPEEIGRLATVIVEANLGKAAGKVEAHGLRKDGTLIDVSFSVAPLFENGVLAGFVGSAEDITELKKAEENLRLLAAVVESTDEAVFCRTLDDRVLAWNGGAERLFGFTFDEIKDAGIVRIVPPDKLEELAWIRSLIENGGSVRGLETVRVDREERRIDVSLSVFPVRDTGGGVIAVGSIARDISASKQAEWALSESHAELEAIFNSASEGIILLDRDCRVVRFNESANRGVDALHSRGFSPGVSMMDFVDDDLLDEFKTYFAGALDGQTVRYEMAPTRSGGRVFSYETMLNPVRLETGEVLGVVLVSRDISRRKQAEQALRDSTADLQAVFASAADGIVLVDNQLRVISYNAAAGPGLRAVKGSHVVAGDAMIPLVAKEYRAEYRRSFKRALAGHTLRSERTYRGEDGRPRWFEIILNPVRLEDGMMRGVAMVSRDITARRRAEEARRLAEDRLRAVAANAPIVLFAIDKDGMFTLSEGAGLAPLGLKPGEVVGQSVYDIYATEPGVLAQVRRCLAGEEFAAEVRIAQGLVFETRYSPTRDAHGQVVGMTGVSVDITERRRSEQALLQAQKLESLGVLAGGIAHDFNNLLVSILGNAGLALMELSPQSAARETIHEIEIAGQRAADLARQMLAYSGKGRFVIQQVDLNELVEEMTHLLRVSIVKGATLHYDFGRGLPAIEGDATQIRQVVMNLVVNASDAIGDREGVIRVSTGLMHADRAYIDEPYLDPDLSEGNYVYVEVEDTGQGMDADTLGKIFDPFFTTKFTGRGLGLAAVLGIVRGHQGAIKVSSTPGKGTTFRLLLPASAVGVKESAAAADPGAWKGAGTVLVIDDEPTVRAVTARACRMFGFDVLTASDGQAGVDLFRQHAGEVACVLMDMTMPRLNGEDAFRQIRAISAEARVIMMSGFDQQEASSRFAGEGMAGFIQKPYELSLLRDELRRVIES